MLIYFFSGACSLIDEVVWVRLLKLTLGNTVYASSIVVSVFMGGLALGALIMGRYADRVRRQLRLYAALEALVTASALLLPWMLQLANAIYRWFFVRFHPSPAGLMVVQLIVSAAILLVPSMLMGSTLPLLGRYVTALRDRVGRLVGRLYALNTFGATLGCFLAGFVLIRMVGVMGTLYVAAGLNLLVALGGWVLSRRGGTARPSPPEEQSEPGAPRVSRRERTSRRVLVLAFFVSGLVSIGYELIWMRSAAFLLGGFTYVFSGVLTVYLLGNVLGAWIGSRLSRRLARPAVAFGISLSCLGLLGVLYLPWFTAWFLKLEPLVKPLLSGSLGAAGIRKAAMPLFHSTVLFFLPAVTMGIGFPLALQAWSNFRHEVGRTTGTVYGANTIGAVLGGVVSGFVLIPLMGVQLSITLLGLLAVWLGWVMVQLFAAKGHAVLRLAHAAAGVALTIAAVVIPTSLFRQDVVGTHPGEVLAVREGVTATVAVHRKPDGKLLMSVDNVPMAGDDIHRSAQKMLGHLGILLHRNPREVLSVGFGSGETAECLARHGLDRIDCVEIAPEVVDVALEFFGHINLGDRLDREVNMMYMDAKSYLRLTDRRYDVIINDSDEHSTSASAPLFTREHFAGALSRLKAGGLFVTKLHLQGHPKSNFDSILATFLDVYPHVTVWFPTTKPFIFLYLVGSRERQVFSPARIDGELAKDAVQAGVEYLNFHDSSDVLSCYVGDANDIGRYLKGGRINSDYAPYIEFNLDSRKLVQKRYFVKLMGTLRRGSVFNHIDWTGLSARQRAKWRTDHQSLYAASSFALLAHGTRAFLQRLQYCFHGLRYAPAHAAILEMQDKSLSGVRRALDTHVVSPERVIADMNTLLRKQPQMGAASLVKSWALQKRNDLSGAFEAATAAARDAPRTAATRANLGAILLRVGRADAAVEHFEQALKINPEDVYSLERLAWCLATCPKGTVRNGARAVELARRAVQAGGYNEAGVQDTLAAACAEAGRFDEAVAAATKALGLAEPTQKSLAEQIRRRLALYRAGRPYRNQPGVSRPAGGPTDG